MAVHLPSLIDWAFNTSEKVPSPFFEIRRYSGGSQGTSSPTCSMTPTLHNEFSHGWTATLLLVLLNCGGYFSSEPIGSRGRLLHRQPAIEEQKAPWTLVGLKTRRMKTKPSDSAENYRTKVTQKCKIHKQLRTNSFGSVYLSSLLFVQWEMMFLNTESKTKRRSRGSELQWSPFSVANRRHVPMNSRSVWDRGAGRQLRPWHRGPGPTTATDGKRLPGGGDRSQTEATAWCVNSWENSLIKSGQAKQIFMF